MREVIYTVYAAESCPQAMLDKYPNAAKYADNPVYLFGETLEQVTGTPAERIVDIAGLDLTNEQLDAQVDSLLADRGDAEVHLSKAQGKYLYRTRFKP